MNTDYPRMLYRTGTKITWNGLKLDWTVVNDAEEEEIALADGWRLSPDPLDHDGDGKKGGRRKKP